MAREKTMDELLGKIKLSRLKEIGVNSQEIAKVEALHDLLRQGKTWEDREVKDMFRTLPDSFPYCTAFVHNDVLIRIGKARPTKIVPRPGIQDSRQKWIPVEKAGEYGVPATMPIKGYEIVCTQCEGVFYGKEPFHQSYCSKCARRRPAEATTEPEQKPEAEPEQKQEAESVKEKAEEKPRKKRGRPSKKDSDKKPASGKSTTKKSTSTKSTKLTKKSSTKTSTKKGGARKKK